MLSLQYPRRWQTASVVLLIFVLAAALMPVVWFWGDRVGGLRWMANVDKWLHALTFFVLALWFSGMFARVHYLLVGIGLLGFGLVIEVCQYLVGYRTADWFDLGANASGIVVGLIIAIAGAGGWCQRIEARWTA